MRCVHCQADIRWEPKTSQWMDSTNNMFQQYCWIDPVLGSELHSPGADVGIHLTNEQRMQVALANIASYPTKSTDASVLAMQRMASEALASLKS
jgi:hypothetical protein